jgi:hypothetical protein
MADRAHVSSVDALESFRAHLLVYLSQARPALEEVSADVVRTRVWLENDQRMHWENQMRRRTKELQEAQQALFSARIGNLRTESSMEQLAVHRAKRAVEEADAKLRTLKKWNREFDGRVQPLVKQMEKLHTVLTNDMAKAVAYLAQAVGTLSAYADIQAPAADGPASPAAAAPSEPKQ